MSVNICKDGFIVFINVYGYPLTLAHPKTLNRRVGGAFFPQPLPRGERGVWGRAPRDGRQKRTQAKTGNLSPTAGGGIPGARGGVPTATALVAGGHGKDRYTCTEAQKPKKEKNMIYLITGIPGSGKTLKMISDLMSRQDLKNRPLYLDGIPDVDGKTIPNLPVPEGETMQTWHKWAPTGAILVIDECQRVFRPRPSGSKVPDYVAELETHRHKGLDIFLLTQHPRLIDSNVRALVGHHCHIAKTNLGVRRMFEWERCGDPTLTKDVQAAVKSVYALDKKAFGVYKSAEEHTKIRTKLSRVVYAFPVVLAVLIGSAYYIYSSWSSRIDDKPHAQQQTQQAQQQPQNGAQAPIPETVQAAQAAAQGAGQYAPPEPQKVHLTAEDYKPRIEGQPHTAPLYDGLNKAVKTMPYPVGCVKNADRCTCYTEQGTAIKGFSKSQCLDFVENGIYNPYKQQQTVENQPPAVQEAQTETGQVLVMGSKSPQNLMYDGYAEKALSNQGAKVGI
uniref:ZOT protein n=1 Tax=Dulem virus 50 TaxID=3145761 RepID=A0AAU8B2V6_9VIRU